MNTRLDPDELAALEEERAFLSRSLSDLDRELEAGDLDQRDHRSLRRDYARRASVVDQAIAEDRASLAATRPPRSTARTVAVVGGVAVFALVCGLLVAQFAGRRDTPEQAGAATDDATQARNQLARCFTLGTQGELLAATECYGAVVEADPGNAEARTYLGWFLYLSGVEELREGAERQIRRAIDADAAYPDARVFLAVILRDKGDLAGAREQLAVLDTLDPPVLVQELVEELRADLEDPAAP